MSIPTGLGKTAGVILAWLWRRGFAVDEIRRATPRRLVYCLPMRVLVEQTARSAAAWLASLGLASNGGSEGVRISVLMGGDANQDWDLFPEQDAILIGTQDMLLSRALNRGYAMSRFRWPVAFGLLNNDCLWVLDEVQLMGSGLSTSTQLEAFRNGMGTVFRAQSQWMSATLHPDWLRSVDFEPSQDKAEEIGLGEHDLVHPDVKARMWAAKPISRARTDVTKDGKAEAREILTAHKAGTLTLVIVNTVLRARAIHAALQKAKGPAKTLLVHSRFRPPDKSHILENLLEAPGQSGTIAVTTQVVEAGVDLSAATLFTDLAPWPSMVQRFGRCNRRGEQPEARIFWFGVPLKKPADALPYREEELREAETLLTWLADAAPANLPPVEGNSPRTHVLRKKDIKDLFDTTPDLAGADLDVSRFIRETDDHDVSVFWRTWEGEKPGPDDPLPARDELCPVPMNELRKLLRDRKLSEAWRWDHLERQWVPARADSIYPGMMLLLPVGQGGYHPEKGWTGDRKDIPEPMP
ncbi:MAG: CRISPR-associated helicase Cas3', partial [Pseudomonadota bacterium]